MSENMKKCITIINKLLIKNISQKIVERRTKECLFIEVNRHLLKFSFLFCSSNMIFFHINKKNKRDLKCSNHLGYSMRACARTCGYGCEGKDYKKNKIIQINVFSRC